jgi:hypothetical protein
MQDDVQQDTTPSEQDFQALEGIWRSRGYGKLLLIRTEAYILHEETAVSCLPVDRGELQALTERYHDLSISPGGQAFSVRRATGVTRVSFYRLSQLPDTISETELRDPDDPEYNFEVFWHTFAENYALFDTKKVNWERAYWQYRRTVSGGTQPEELFSIMTAMLRPLRDGHVRLNAHWSHYSAEAQPAFYTRLEKELEEAGDDRDVPSYLAELREWLHDVIHEDYLGGRVRHGAHHLVEWGQLGDNTGFLNLRAMAGQSGHIGCPAEDLDATDAIMQTVLGELGHLPNLVVDIRGNGGGYDGVALRFAAYLTDRKRMAFSKAARHCNGYTGRQPVYVTPAPTGTYSGNIYLLTSELTASAAEILVLALLQHPRVTRIGEPTQGILSDTLERHLPNGWHLTLSNEIYRAFDETLYEDVGIPPHISMDFLDSRGRDLGQDPMLDRVLDITANG